MKLTCVTPFLLLSTYSLVYANPIPTGDSVQPRQASSNPTGDEGSEPEPDTCPDYSTCLNKGAGYWNGLFNQLRQDNPVDRKNGANQFATYYASEVEENETPDDTIESYVKSLGLDFTNAFDKTHVSSRTSANGPAYGYYAYENDYNLKQGVIVADTNNRRDDDIQKKLTWSEVAFQTYQTSTNRQGQALSLLSHVFRVNIINPQTNAVVEAAYDKLGLDKTDPNAWVEWTIEEHQDSFIAFIGTDNVKGVAFLLRDHTTAFNKRIISVITRVLRSKLSTSR